MKKKRTNTERASRGTLSRDRVLAAAVAIADEDGIEAVTMRRLAADLGVEAMSLYHHLPGKERLLDGLVDAVAREIEDATAQIAKAGWSASIRQRCLTARAVMLRHPWAPALIGTRRSIPPRLLLHYEAILAAMVEGGFSYHLAHRAMHALGSMALGFVQELFSPSPGEPADSSGFAEMMGQLPTLTAMIVAETHAHDGATMGWCDSQAEFEFTLDLLLEGLERRRKEETRLART